MTITTEISNLWSFEAWSGAKYTKDRLLENGIDDEFITYAEEILGDNCSDTELNDFLWFESDMIFEHFGLDELGIPKNDEEDNEE